MINNEATSANACSQMNLHPKALGRSTGLRHLALDQEIVDDGTL